MRAGRGPVRERSWAASQPPELFDFDFAFLASGKGLRAYFAMNDSVASRASSSGRWCIGDFIR